MFCEVHHVLQVIHIERGLALRYMTPESVFLYNTNSDHGMARMKTLEKSRNSQEMTVG